jgi:hypothetical protein
MFKTYVVRGDIQINSIKLVEEMNSFVDNPRKDGALRHHLAAAPGYHDDRIMAISIALYIAHELDIMSIADERRRRVDALDASKKHPVKPKQIWQIMASGRIGQTPDSIEADILEKMWDQTV